MLQHERALRPALAGLVILCFLMPFVKISCGGQPIASMTGVDLALGKKPEPPTMFGDQMGNQFGSQFGDILKTPDGAAIAKPYEMTPSDSAGMNSMTDDTSLYDTAYANGMEAQNQQIISGPEDAGFHGEPFAIASILLAAIALFTAFGVGRKTKLVSTVTSGLAAVALFILKMRLSAEMPTEAAQVIAIEWAVAYWIALVGAGLLAVLTGRVLSNNPQDRPKPRLVIQSYSDNQTVGSR